MSQPFVDVVLVNYRRAANIAVIIKAMRAQTIPNRIILVDSSAGTPHDASRSAKDVDLYFPLPKNFGAYGRYAPMAFLEQDYVWFHDDDAKPGRRCLENFLHWSNFLRVKHLPFGVLGQNGRLLPPAMDQYCRKAVLPTDVPQPVDTLVRSYFTKTASLSHLLAMKSLLGEAARIDDKPFAGDDLLLCTAATFRSNQFNRNYVIPATDSSYKMNAEELPAPYPAYKTTQHFPRRDAIVRKLGSIGYIPVGGTCHDVAAAT